MNHLNRLTINLFVSKGNTDIIIPIIVITIDNHQVLCSNKFIIFESPPFVEVIYNCDKNQ